MTAVPDPSQSNENSFVPPPELELEDAFETQEIRTQHPLVEPLLDALELKAKRDYAGADSICWELLKQFDVRKGSFAETPNQTLLSQIPEEDRLIVARIVYELAISFEASLRGSNIRDESGHSVFSGKAFKAYLLPADLDPYFPPAAFHLAALASHLKPEDLVHLSYEVELPLLQTESEIKVLADFQELCLVKLLNAFDCPPYDLSAEHFAGELPLPETLIVRAPLDREDPRFTMINELTWMLSDAAKLSVNIANYYRHYDPNNSSLGQYIDFTRQFAGTLLNIFDVPREVGKAQTSIEQNRDTFGNRRKSIVSALTNLGSAANMKGDLESSRSWYRAALTLDPDNSFARQRLEVLTSNRRTDPHVVKALLNSLDTKDVPAVIAKDWQIEFAAAALNKLHHEIIASIQREKISTGCPALLPVAVEAGKRLRVLFGAGADVAESYMNYLEGEEAQGQLWGEAYLLEGNLTVQSHLSTIQLCQERKLLPETPRLKALIETLEQIRDSSFESLELPRIEAQHTFYRQLLGWIQKDLTKR